MQNEQALKIGTDILHRQGRMLDEQRWDDWLGLFTEACEYWVPAWTSETRLTQDPDSEVSLIYYDLRSRLADRVWRVGSGQSVANDPMPRTCHFVSNIDVDECSDSRIKLFACFRVDYHVNKQSFAFFGHYHYQLVPADEGKNWLIDKKKVIIMNDYIPTMMDFYLV
ncbi:MAG: aromatic-ring-hydroxylating dioxygenase subunit beta [Gammaproteobacteria bacterium]